jgi:hypothetical protein
VGNDNADAFERLSPSSANLGVTPFKG